ncbi:transposase [Streptacidiphilus rugosus]|uniref:transposase n=1 Tax=Streptacidiphilus rugosus TaxID=405783 RepID=UPI000569D0E3|nr:transposase [Streptacidiphilus rugosus]
MLGIDQFALRSGHVYATILMPSKPAPVVAALPDRSTDTVSAWMADRPGMEVICRDPLRLVRQGGHPGAPDAVNVAEPLPLVAQPRTAAGP